LCHLICVMIQGELAVMYDLIIIGLGPAGVAAAVYAGRNKLKTLVVGEEIGGQSVVSTNIQNWIGIPSLSGEKMAAGLADHLETVKEDVEVSLGSVATSMAKLEKNGKTMFKVITKDKEYEATTVLIASGGRRKKLEVPGEETFIERGVYYCTVCDAPLMADKKVAVVGGGNAGLESVINLLPYASLIYLMEITDQLRGDKKTQERALQGEKVKVLLNARVLEIFGDQFVTGLAYEDLTTKEQRKIDLDGVFVEIGSIPNSEFAKDLVEINRFGEIDVDPLSGRTSQEGIWAAGDVTSLPYKQNNIAMGDAVRATLSICDYLMKER
jgi:alkyl hydroperoxide reductase subunit F